MLNLINRLWSRSSAALLQNDMVQPVKGIFSHGSSMALDVAMQVCPSTTLVQTELSQQQQDEMY